tara:strand:+ start:697 stop:963 length:267 start_codon:yes stop_codon:yes gene_type:complete
MKVILVKYLAATDHKGERFKASALDWGSVTVGWDYSLGYSENVIKAGEALVEKVFEKESERIRPTVVRDLGYLPKIDQVVLRLTYGTN